MENINVRFVGGRKNDSAFAALLFSCMFFVFLLAGLLVFPLQVKARLVRDMGSCFGLLIPSLFPFVALSSYGVNAPVGCVINRLLSPFTRYILRLPENCGVTVIMGLIGGYPSGASGISSLLSSKQIDRQTAARLLCFCVNPGVAFVISFLGMSVLNSRRTGLLLFCSVLLSSLLIGIVLGLFSTSKPRELRSVLTSPQYGGSVVTAATAASTAMIKMTACIMFFSVAIAILEGSGFLSLLAGLLSTALNLSLDDSSSLLLMMLEISGGVISAAGSPPLLLAFSLAFSSVSIHMQLYSFFDDFPMNKALFVLMRLLHGIAASIIFLLLSQALPDTRQVFLNSSPSLPITVDFGTAAAGGISLLIMCIAFLLMSRHENCKAEANML